MHQNDHTIDPVAVIPHFAAYRAGLLAHRCGAEIGNPAAPSCFGRRFGLGEFHRCAGFAGTLPISCVRPCTESTTPSFSTPSCSTSA